MRQNNHAFLDHGDQVERKFQKLLSFYESKGHFAVTSTNDVELNKFVKIYRGTASIQCLGRIHPMVFEKMKELHFWNSPLPEVAGQNNTGEPSTTFGHILQSWAVLECKQCKYVMIRSNSKVPKLVTCSNKNCEIHGKYTSLVKNYFNIIDPEKKN